MNATLAERTLTLEDVADRLPRIGDRAVSYGTVRRWAVDGLTLPDGRHVRLQAVRVGKRLVVRPAALDAFLAALSQPAA